MKRNKITMKWSSALLIVLFVSSTFSCGDGFLDTSNPDKLNTDNFPTSVDDIELLVNDVYGRLRSGFLDSDPQAKIGYGVSHYADQAYSDNNFDAGSQNNFNANSQNVLDVWKAHYENINKANSTLDAIEKLRSINPNLTPEMLQTLSYREGEVRFIRAFNYYYLINFFGERSVSDPSDKEKMGVPIITSVAQSLGEAQVSRNTVGEVWNFIKSDLRKAQDLLNNKTWSGSDKARIGVWAVKSFLGKAHVFTQQWDSAKLVLKDVIDNSGKSLVPYDIYRDMYINKNQFNEESIFEINFNDKQVDGNWSNATNAVTYFPILISPAYIGINDLGGEEAGCNGFCNFIIHDKSIQRFGWNDTTKVDYKQAAYLNYAEQVRTNQTVDPRLWVSAQLPRVDSIFVDDKEVAIGKNFGEGIRDVIGTLYGWSFRKYTLTNRSVWAGAGINIAMNLSWIRLADVYLLYAEACQNTGDNANALEYINKVKRRAYGLPVDSSSPKDYASLTATTSAPVGDILHTDPLKYERWVELFGEQGNWWFDVCRWRIGASEAAYYEKVATAPLTWDDRKYALPIPQLEINANSNMKQNPGY